MKFIAHIGNYSVGILTPVQEVLPGGLTREIVPLFVAQFRPGELTLEELEFAEREFAYVHGRAQMQDEVTMAPILNRLSSYDSESRAEQAAYEALDQQLLGIHHPLLERDETWDFGALQRVTEAKLLKAQSSGNFKLFEADPATAPWPTYNEFTGTAEDLVAVLEAQGHSLPGVLAYERQNLNRPDVTALIEERLAQQAEEYVA